MGGAVQHIVSKDYELTELDSMYSKIKRITEIHRVQYSVIPLPESVTDTSHTGWRLSLVEVQ